jgi:hypothetical protein
VDYIQEEDLLHCAWGGLGHKKQHALELANQSSSESFDSFFNHINLANTPLSITGKHFFQADL